MYQGEGVWWGNCPWEIYIQLSEECDITAKCIIIVFFSFFAILQSSLQHLLYSQLAQVQNNIITGYRSIISCISCFFFSESNRKNGCRLFSNRSDTSLIIHKKRCSRKIILKKTPLERWSGQNTLLGRFSEAQIHGELW